MVNCPDCELPDKEWWKRLETSEHYLRKTCGICGISEVVEDEIRFCDCGGEYKGWKPRESKGLNNKHLPKGRKS